MNLLFTYIVTGLLVVLGLLPLGDDFPYTPLYIALALLGLGVSFWQQKKRPIPYLRLIANIILVAFTVRALFPFFAGKPKYDMFTALIATWIYFLILSTYIIHTKRDYYIIQGLSLGLIVYACFYATHNPLSLLGYTAAFLVVWIMALRNINLFPEGKEEKTIFYTTRDIWREIKLGAILFFAVVIISLLFYFLLPRFNMPLLPMGQLLRQRYSAIYADFPKRGLVMFLSRNPKDIMTEKKELEGKTPSPTQKGVRQGQLDIRQNIKKPIFWRNLEDIEKIKQKIQKTDQELKDLAQQNKLPEVQNYIQEHQKLLEQEEKINEDKKELEKTLQKTKEEYLKMAQIQFNPPQELAGKPEALKELEDKMKNSEDKIEKMANERKAMDKQIDKIKEAINEIRDSIYKQSSQTTQKIRILWDKKEEQHEELKKVKEEGKARGSLAEGSALSQSMENQEQNKPDKDKESKTKKTETQKTTRQITILDILLYILIIVTVIHVTRSILAFVFPYLKHKRRISRASRNGQYNLSISLIYNFLGRVLYIFGYKYPMVMLPEEYLKAINKRFAAISHYTHDLTNLFIEARYSTHQLKVDQEKQAFENYRNILQELKNSGVAWQRQILKIGFLFEL